MCASCGPHIASESSKQSDLRLPDQFYSWNIVSQLPFLIQYQDMMLRELLLSSGVINQN